MAASSSIEVCATDLARGELGATVRVRGVKFVRVASARVALVLVHLADVQRSVGTVSEMVKATSGARLPVVIGGQKRQVSYSGVLSLSLLTQALGGVAPLFSPEVVRRVLEAQAIGAAGELVAEASVVGDRLLVWSCEPKLYQCPIEEIPALVELGENQRKTLRVSPSGSRIHWDAGDIDLDLDAVRVLSDPAAKKDAERALRAEAQNYGEAIQRLRRQAGLRQADIPGLSEREVRRIEKGETFPHAASLDKLARAHGWVVRDYMSRLADLYSGK